MVAMGVLDLHVCIIGAGMGGLGTALALAKQGFRKIEVYEAASDLGFVGAGIQLAPNMARILDRWGVWTEVERDAVELQSTSIRRMLHRQVPPTGIIGSCGLIIFTEGSTNEELGYVDLRSIRERYAFPHMVGHRSSLAGALFAGCQRETAITFHFSTSAGTVHAFGPQPWFEAVPRHGAVFAVHCDLLIAADGVKSAIRDQLLRTTNTAARIVDTGTAAYRIMLTRAEMQHDAELLALLDADAVTRWIGPQRHIIAYPVAGKEVYNISTAQPDTHFAAAPSATYTTTGSKPEMQEVFSDFCPLVRRMLDLVPAGEVCEWRLRVHDPLTSWVLAQTALVGDACHSTLPHLAQGAAQAIEDAAVLGVVLGKLAVIGDASPSAVHRALRVYEAVRMDRANTFVEMAAANGRALHLGDGAAKEERDRQFAALKTGKGPVPDKWADADVQRMIYGVDIMTKAENEFDRIYGDISPSSA